MSSSFINLFIQLFLAESAKATEMYLFGNSVTVADIGFYVFITRLQILGLLPQLVPSTSYPLIHRHLVLMSARPSIGQLVGEVSKLRYTLLVEDIKASASYVALALGIGCVLFASYFVIKKIKSS